MPSLSQRLTFTSTLAVTMASATFALVVFGVLAAELIAEFGVDRWQIGVLVTASALGGAVVSLWLGVLSDRIGARRATIATLTVSALSLAFVGLAPTFFFLAMASLLTGSAQAWSNPATNKLISYHVEPGRRGVITGIKQSGVQIGTFLGGLLLPVFAAWWGWRWAVLAFTSVPLLWVLLSWLTLPRDPEPETTKTTAGSSDAIPGFIKRVGVYGFLLGAGGTTIFTYLPLYGQEELGLSQRLTGTAVAVTGFVGIIARIGWGRIAELRLGSVRALTIIAGLAAVAGAVLLIAPLVGAPLLWLAAVVTGASASAWNSVGMLAIIQGVPGRLAGRGSGVVLIGFLGGLGVGAPLFGWSVDLLGTYAPGWAVVTLIFLSALLLMRKAEAVMH